MCEVDAETLARARIVVDQRAAALVEAGDLLQAHAAGQIAGADTWLELGQLVSGEQPGRQSADEITCFKSVGLGIQDLFTAMQVYERASALGIGWGGTLRETVRHLTSANLRDLSINSMMGGLTRGSELNTFEIASELARASYRQRFVQLFGPSIFNDPDRLVSEAMFALVRYQIEDPSFHAFTSKYDAWLQGKARLTAAEAHGLQLFNDPQKGNCAACHLSQPGRDGLPPLFTDSEYEALGVPRNPDLPLNKDPKFFDLGLCGPIRKDLAQQKRYCGMFLTPTLRNVDRRAVFFHNGVYHTLQQVLNFYNLRSVRPEKIYPHDAGGKLTLYNDIPEALQGNVDVKDAPFDLKVGAPPALTNLDMQDIIAFIHTLDDGYAPTPQQTGHAAAGTL